MCISNINYLLYCSELKTRQKLRKKEEEKKVKDKAKKDKADEEEKVKADKGESGGATKKKPKKPVEEELDPTKYTENRKNNL